MTRDELLAIAPKYPHIDTLWKRSSDNRIIPGEFTQPHFQYLANLKWSATEKIDGTNIRLIFSPQHPSMIVGGRTDKAQIPSTLLSYLDATYSRLAPAAVLAQAAELSSYASLEMVTIFGEGFGAGIQKVGRQYRPRSVDFIAFQVVLSLTLDAPDQPLKEYWLDPNDPIQLAILNALEIPVVPTRYAGSTLSELVAIVRSGFDSVVSYEPMAAEGLVARPAVFLRDRYGKPIVTKLKTVDYRG